MRVLALLSLLSMALSADTVTLKNGRIMNGTYLGGTAREVRLDMGDHVETIQVERISTLLFDNSSPAPASAPAADAAPPPPPPPPAQAPQQPASNYDRFNTNPQPANNAPPPPAVANTGVLVPQGTPLTVRMIDSVDSQKAQLGEISAPASKIRWSSTDRR
jgi:hypothetical protein